MLSKMISRAAYDNVAVIGNFPEMMADFCKRSADIFATHNWMRELSYGPTVRERFCWHTHGVPSAPTFIFIHGGYWQASSKDDHGFIAEGLIKLGFNVGLIEYTLAPNANLTTIVEQIARALNHVQKSRESLNIGPQVVLAGHSAGGQLAALFRNHPLVTLAMTISGIMELEPISRLWINEKLQLTEREISTLSPQRVIGEGAPLLATYGGNELPELIRHSCEYAKACAAAGQTVNLLEVPDCNHFEMLQDLAFVDGYQLKALMEFID